MALKLTEEQDAILKASDTAPTLVVDALAGTGKTSTLKELSKRKQLRNQKGLYLAYNKSIQLDAEGSFPQNVTCKTANSVAWKSVIKYQASPLGKRLSDSVRMPTRVVADILNIRKGFTLQNDVVLTPEHQARMVMDTVKRFCNSAATEIMPSHVPYQDGVSDSEFHELMEIIYPKAKWAWEDVQENKGSMKFDHDHYLKMWQLSNPTLEYDFIMLDEAQDANPVISDVFENQTSQKIMVGDANQAIYGWRGAIDAMKNFSGKRLSLTQSFRFGEEIANEANKFLTLLESELRVKGFGEIDSVVQLIEEPDTILCRTNAECVRNVIQYQKIEKKVCMVGGGQDIKSFAFHALALMQGKKPQFPYPPLVAFKDWAELLDYVENDEAGSDLKVNVKLMRNFGPSAVIEAMAGLVEEKEAEMIVSTAHKSKGREWGKVKIGMDFMAQVKEDSNEPPSKPDLMLDYVSVTRAMHEYGYRINDLG